jgi:hypothetical protein
MIRKIIILWLIALAAFIFYKKFMADSLEPFFRRHSGNVDLLLIKTPDFKVKE